MPPITTQRTTITQGKSRIVAGGMLRENTPIEYYQEYNLWVKREDKACVLPGPQFSKTRGVFARVASRDEKLIGVLDTAHSQAGHAVARACQILGKQCINFYPEFKHTPGPKPPQIAAKALGATLHGLPAGRSAILYHAARRVTESLGGYIMPNALKLHESVTETAKEVPDMEFDWVVISISSGTIAAGVIKGFLDWRRQFPKFIIHLGYTRSHDEVTRYLFESTGVEEYGMGADMIASSITLVDEKYQYKDRARGTVIPPWPCNAWYDLKTFQWFLEHREDFSGRVLFWNIG